MIDATGVQSLTIPITDMADGLINRWPDMQSMRKGNIMARCRMIVLFDQSAVSTGWWLARATRPRSCWDTQPCSAIQPALSTRWETFTRPRCASFRATMGIPEVIIGKAPTADLWSGQTDEGELGFTYAEVDKLLYLLVDERFTPQECVEAGFDKKFVDIVVARVRRFHFKRVMPPIAKLSNRTVGYDFLYLRDWGT